MNGSNVLEIVLPEADPSRVQVIYGLVPAHDQDILKRLSATLLPGLEELAGMSMEEFEPGHIMFDILYGAKQVYIFYANRGPEVPEGEGQKDFARRIFASDPRSEFAAFAVLEPLRVAGFHIYAAYVEPAYRNTDIMKVGLSAIEKEAKKMGSPYISMASRIDIAAGLERLGYKLMTGNYRKKLKE